jgi:hypothetical protein
LAEKRVDINIHAAADEGRKSRASTEEVRENEQNVRNRRWEVTYSGHIQRYVMVLVLVLVEREFGWEESRLLRSVFVILPSRLEMPPFLHYVPSPLISCPKNEPEN